MKRKHAVEAIKAILAAIDDDEMPEAKVKTEGGTTIAWIGGMGYHLGSAKRNGVHDPLIYRDKGAHDAIEREAVYRLDQARKQEPRP